MLREVRCKPDVGFYSYDAVPVPLELVRTGPNEFHVYSTTEHHAAEINWPGPVLFIEYATEPPDR